ncbi:MAG: hypothetical protein WAJ97_11005 [Terriglobales bacterium]
MKKTSLFVALMLIAVIGASTASFAACTATSLTTAPGVWGLEAYGHNGSGVLVNDLIQATFASGGAFTGTEWESVGGTVTGPTTISGTWAMVSPAADCQGTITVTSPSTQTFNFALNNTNKGLTLAQIDTGYTMGGFGVAQGVIAGGACTNLMEKNKLFSLYSNGTIPAVGGLVTGTGELKFGTTGTTIVALPTLTLDLGGAGNLISSGTGTSNLNSNCTGTGSLTATPGGTFDVDTVVVDAGKEMLFLVTNPGDNVSGYFLQ